MKSSSGDEQGLDLETDCKIDQEKPDYEDQRPKTESNYFQKSCMKDQVMSRKPKESTHDALLMEQKLNC